MTPPRKTIHRCPECLSILVPIYCAAATDEAPLLLALGWKRAAAMLGIHEVTLLNRAEPWRDGWRLRRVEQMTQPCRWCGLKRLWRRGALANHERQCLNNPNRRDQRQEHEHVDGL